MRPEIAELLKVETEYFKKLGAEKIPAWMANVLGQMARAQEARDPYGLEAHFPISVQPMPTPVSRIHYLDVICNRKCVVDALGALADGDTKNPYESTA